MAYNPQNPNGQATGANSTPVVIASDQTTIPVSTASLPLPTGASTEATLSALNTKVTAVNTGAVTISTALPTGVNTIGAVNVNGTVPVSATALPLPTGASTEATLSALNTKITAVNTNAVAITSGAIPTNATSTGTLSATDAVVAAPIGDGTLISGASTAGSIVAIAIPNGFVAWTLMLKGYVSGTIYTEASTNSTNGTDGDWTEVKGRKTGTAVGVESTTYAQTANGYYRGNCAGFTYIRARLIGGTGPTILWYVSAAQGATFLNSGIPTGGSIIGKVGIDQTTPGTTNLVSIGTNGTVAINTALPTGANTIGAVNVNGTIPVSATALPLPTGASTEATLSALNTKVTAVNTGAVTISTALPTGANVIGSVTNTNLDVALSTRLKPSDTLTAVTTVGSVTAITNALPVGANTIGNVNIVGTVPVSATALPLPTGASTEATLSALNSKVTSVNTGAVTISTALPTGTNIIGALTANQSVNHSQINGVTPATGNGVSGTGTQRVNISSDNTAFPVNVSSSGLAIGARADGFLRTLIDPTTLLFDTFETLDTTNTWTTGGTVPPTAGTGSLSFVPSTIASATSYISSKPSFIPGASAYLQFSSVLQIEATAVTGNQRFWGVGVITTPTITVPVTNGSIYEIDNATGALFASIYSSGARTQTVTITRPTDAAYHRYAIYHKASKVYFEVDNITVATFSFPNPSVAAFNIVSGSVNGGTAIATSPVLNVSLFGIGDTGRNFTQLSDGTYQWRKATIKPASTAVVATDTALSVGLHPSSPLPTGNNTIGVVSNANIDVALSTRLKPADTLAAVTTLGTITNALPTGANKIGTVDIATAPAVAKGTQGTNALPTQDLIDSGRNQTTYFMAVPILTTATDALVALTGYKGGATVATTTTPAVVTSGKTFRITSITLTYVAIITAGTAQFTIRAQSGGVVTITSPAVQTFSAGAPSATAGITMSYSIPVPDGFEFPAGTGIGVSMIGRSSTQVAAATGYGQISIHGFEY